MQRRQPVEINDDDGPSCVSLLDKHYPVLVLFTIGIGFILCVTSLTTTMISIDLTAILKPVTTNSSDNNSSINVSTPAPYSVTTAAPGDPNAPKSFTITCPMFGACQRSGGDAPHIDIDGIVIVCQAFDVDYFITSIRGICLFTLASSSVSTILAAAAAQENSCAQHRLVRRIICGAAAFTCVFAIACTGTLWQLVKYLNVTIDTLKFLKVSSAVNRYGIAVTTSNAAPLYSAVLFCCFAAAVEVALWINGTIGPPTREEAADAVGKGDSAKKGEEMAVKRREGPQQGLAEPLI